MRISDWSSDVCSSDLAGVLDLVAIGQDEVLERGLRGAVHAPEGARGARDRGGERDHAGAVRRAKHRIERAQQDGKSVVEGKSVSVRVEPGARRTMQQQKKH